MRKVYCFGSLFIGLLFCPVVPAQAPAVSGGPLSLTAAIQIGLNNNPEIKAAKEKIRASKGRFWSSISPAPADVSITRDDVPAGSGLSNYGEKTVGISQSLEFPTNYFLRGSKSVIERKIAENEFTLAELGVISKVKKAYYHAVALQEQVKIARENLAIAKDFAQKAEVRFSVGEGTNLEKMTAKVNYTEALNAVEIQNNHVTIAFAELSLALGYGKDESMPCQLSDTLAFVPLNFTLDRLMNEATSSHPLLTANTLQVASCTVDKSLAWSGVLPGFNLAYFSKKVRQDATNYYGASFSIGIPLWFMLDQRGKVTEALSNEAMAMAELKAANNDIYAKTQSAFAEFKHGESQVHLYNKELMPQAEEIFRMAARSYEAGEITYIEFLQAQQTLINARGGYTEALLSYMLSIVAIEEAIGKQLP